MAIVGIDHVQLAAPPDCEEEARRFFGDLLGLEELAKPDALRRRGGVWFECGTQQLHIGVEDGFRPAAKAHPAFRVADFEGVRARLTACGVEVRDDDAIPGVRRFYVDDPWGNRLELVDYARG